MAIFEWFRTNPVGFLIGLGIESVGWLVLLGIVAVILAMGGV
jgi:hypothetical protein